MSTHVLAVVPFWFPHLAATFESLREQADLSVTTACLGPLPRRRRDLGWPEAPEDGLWLQPWRTQHEGASIERALRTADVAVLPGPLGGRSAALMAVKRKLARRPLAFWSEPFLAEKPRTSVGLLARSALLRALDGRGTHLLAVGPTAADDYRALGLARARAWLLPYAAEPIQDDPPARSGPLHLLFVGELITRKGVDLLVEALAEPTLAALEWSLEVVGDGPERHALEALAAARGLASRMRFVGTAPEAGRTAYPGRDVLVLPSRFDGWGLVVNEAMEQGLAVVASSAASASLLVQPGVTGAVVPTGDVPALARILADLAGDPESARLMGTRGRAAILAWRPARVAGRLAPLLRAIAGHGPWPDPSSGPAMAL